jgi:TatD DNase family protein
MIDTHAHLYLCNRKIEELVQNAKAAGLTKIINVALDIATAETCLRIHKQYPHIYPTVGLYPGEAYTDATFNQLEEKIKTGDFVAIGEIGLDYFKMRASKESQRTAFIKQLALARQYDMPVIIHNRHTEDDMIDIVPQFPTVKKVFHCFGSHLDFIEKVDSPTTYYSFTGTVTYAKKGKTIRAIEQIPLEKMMLETDCPYLTPRLHKGQENQPAFIPEIAKRIAEIKNITIDDVIDQTTLVANNFFSL